MHRIFSSLSYCTKSNNCRHNVKSFLAQWVNSGFTCSKNEPETQSSQKVAIKFYQFRWISPAADTRLQEGVGALWIRWLSGAEALTVGWPVSKHDRLTSPLWQDKSLRSRVSEWFSRELGFNLVEERDISPSCQGLHPDWCLWL